jgi:hypothetical protein
MLNATDQALEAPKRLGGVTGKGWMPGQSGCAGGKAKKTDDERLAEQLAREASPRAMRRLITMSENKTGKVTEAGSLRATELVLAYGLGRPGVRDGESIEGVTFVVQQLNMVATPTPGVLTSPVQGHVFKQQLIASSGEVIENEAS